MHGSQLPTDSKSDDSALSMMTVVIYQWFVDQRVGSKFIVYAVTQNIPQ